MKATLRAYFLHPPLDLSERMFCRRHANKASVFLNVCSVPQLSDERIRLSRWTGMLFTPRCRVVVCSALRITPMQLVVHACLNSYALPALCQLINGSEFMEGDFHKLENESVPRSTDIVFIVEAKDCNKNVLENRNMASLLTVLSKELITANIKENRFSLVVFGGDGVFDLPRSIVVSNNVFSEVQQFLHYFENIPTGKRQSHFSLSITA
uniref:Uncharacterized protein n=1 Tax=Timema tahoe TaxID=61484 RepID=A0A7R9NZH7_9NEOP|nr:unnamed protein product [Timema tahoe]